MSMMRRTEREEGVVSIFMTLVMMLVITLLVLGFAEIVRNGQRSSLDDQLSAQAYYAAESGINDVRAVMNAAVAAGSAVQDKTVCGAQGSYTASSTVDASHSVAYTCVLVDASPTTLNYTLSSTSTIVPLESSSGGGFGTLNLTWKVGAGYPASSGGCYTNLSSLNSFPIASGSGQWGCNYPLVRLDLYDGSGPASRVGWQGKTSTVFLVPFNSNSVGNSIGFGAHGTTVPARCDNTSCQVSITGLGSSVYYARFTALYRTNAPLSISAGGTQFVYAQATIDSTGKAQDVLRRILVAVDLTDANAKHIPSAGIVSQDSVCKRFGITNGSLDIYDDMSTGGGGNSLCSLQSTGTPIP